MTTLPVTFQERVPVTAMRGGAPAAAAGGGFTPADLIRVLRQRMFLILFVWIFISGIAVAATLYMNRYHQKWTSSAVIMVESPFPKTPMQFGEPIMQAEVWDRYVADQLVLVKDVGVLQEALLAPTVQATQWFKELGDQSPQLALKNSIGASQIPETNFFVVQMSTRNPSDAPEIINTVVGKYLGKVKSLEHDEYAGELTKYEQQYDKLESDLETIRQDKLRFVQDEIGTAGITEGVNVVGEMWQTLANEVIRLEAEKLQYKAAWENLQSVDESEIAVSPQMMLMIQQDPQVMALQNLILEFDKNRLFLLRSVGENHRSVKNVNDNLDVLRQKLDEVMAKREKEVRDYEVNSARTIYLNAIQAEMQLRERMQEAEYKQRDLDRALAQYRIKEEEQYQLEQRLNQVQAYINQLRLVINEQDIVRVDARLAQKPIEPSFPNVKLFIGGGTAFGLLIALGLAILLELMDTSLRTTRDVIRSAHVPILGPVPDVDDDEIEIDQPERAVMDAPRSMVAEAFRTIRTNLLLSSPADRQRTLLVTSARPEEGKTTVAVNLAVSLSQSGRRVLLIDANFHRPALKQFFPEARDEGLSNILIGQSPFEDLISTTKLPNVDILTTGPIPPNPTELLASSYFHQLLADAAKRYDQVILDGPPVLLMSDALVITGSVDGVILVCRAKKTSRGMFTRARDQLDRVNGRIFGAVLNAARVSRGGYFREQIRIYYDYQPDDVAAGSRTLPDRRNTPDDLPEADA